METFRDPAVHVWEEALLTTTDWAATSVPRGLARGRRRTRRRLARRSRRPRRPQPRRDRQSARAANRDDDRHRLYTDGGARGNPGPAGIGARLLDAAGDVVEELADSIGTATNNVAEYQALLAGLELALDHDVQRLDVFLDSELVVRQVNGQYKVKDAGLKPLHAQACLLLSRFHEVDVKHVRREQNAEADAPGQPGDRRRDELGEPLQIAHRVGNYYPLRG